MGKLINDTTQIFNRTLNGGIVSCGNSCAIIGSVNNKINKFTKIDGTYTDNWNEIGSSSYLDIPNQSTILYAVLEWHSTIANNLTNGDMPEHYTPVTFLTPLGTNQVYINPSDSTEAIYTDLYNDKISVKWKNVTDLVQQTGSGYYGVKGIATASVGNILNHNEAPGWSLTVVYINNTLPKRTIILYIGIKQSMYTIPKVNSAITITGVNVPSIPKKANMLIVATNGDPNYYAGISIYSDISQIGNIGSSYYLGNSVDSTYDNPNKGIITPYDNMFSGIIMNTNTESSNYGQIETRGTLGNNNNNPFDTIRQLSFQGNRGKLDILGFDISSNISSSQNQLIVTVDTKKLPSAKPRIIVCGVQIDQTDKPTLNTINPNISLVKTMDKNNISIGDVVTFTNTISNLGSIPIDQVILNDFIPKEAIFIKNSLIVNENNILGDLFKSNGISLGNISNSQTITVKYQVKFTIVPLLNIVGINPSISYNYTNVNQSVVSESLMGTTSYLTVKSFDFISITNDVQDIFSKTLNGGITITGNSLVVVGTNNNNSREYISQDGGLTVDWRKNGSKAYLDLPPNSIVVKAILEWNGTIAYGGSIMSENNDPIIFKTPTSTFNVTAMGEARVDEGNDYIHSAKWSDVTSYITGVGIYGVNRVPSAQNASIDNTGKTGWSLTVVYSNYSLPNRFINIKIGLKSNNSNFSLQQRAVTFTGFKVSNILGKSHLMMVAVNGIPSVKNGLNIFSDINNINNTSTQYALGNQISATSKDPGTIPIVPYDNIFGGFIMNTNTENTNYYGKIENRGTLGTLNNTPYNIDSQSSFTGNRTKHDILAFDISNAMNTNQNTLIAVVNMIDSTESILNAVYALQIDQPLINLPTMIVNKTVTRKGVYLGEKVTYKIIVQNNSQINVTGVILIDTLPQGAMLVMDSILVNGTLVNSNEIPIEGINIGNLSSGNIAIITYQIAFNFTPTINPVLIQPTINYNYLDSNNSIKTASCIGTSDSLFVAYLQKPIPILNNVESIYSNTLKGGLVITGNALTVVGSTNDKAREFITESGNTTIDWRQNGSSAILDIPVGSIIISAYLQWYSSISANGAEMLEGYDPVIFKTPSSNYTIFATGESRFNIDNLNINSSKWADVTSYITVNGTEQYTINRVPSAQNASLDHTQITGWSLIVVYYNANLPNRFVNVKVGSMPNNSNFTKLQRVVDFTGFTVMPIETKAYLMMVAANGIPSVKNGLSIYSDISAINNTSLQYQLGNTASGVGMNPGTNPIVPYDNIFGGFIMNTNTEGVNFGKIDTTGTLGNKNNTPYNINSEPSFIGNRAKHDILAFDISNNLSVNQNRIISVVEQFDFNNEWILGVVYALQVDVGERTSFIVTASKTSNRIGVYLGEIVIYTITIGNISEEIVKNVILMESIPEAATLVIDSLTVNGILITGSTFPNDGILLGDIVAGGTSIVSYKITFSSIPTMNPVSIPPVVNYNYVDNNNITKNSSFIGTVESLIIASIQAPISIINNVISVYENTLKGGVIITGNALTVVGPANNNVKEYMSQDGTLTTDWTQNGSESYLDIPSNSTIVKAFLEWNGTIAHGGAIMNAANDPIIFKTPSSTWTVFATGEARFNESATLIHSVKWADVTSYISGVGIYAVNRVPSAQDATNVHSGKTGWSLTVIYSNNSLPNRFINAKIGIKPNNANFTATQSAVTFTGFIVPPTPGNTHFMMVASDGVPNYKNGLTLINDIANISNTALKYKVGNTAASTGQDPGTMPIVPYDNVFGGFIMNTNTENSSAYGKIETRGTRGANNNSPYNITSQQSFKGNRGRHDILAFNISSALSANQKKLVAVVEGIQFNSEWVLGMVYALQVDLEVLAVTPTLTVSKTSSVSTVAVGTALTYTIAINNTGTVALSSVLLMESVPQGSSFVSNSLTVNGTIVTGTALPTAGVSIGNITVGSNAIVSYQVIFNSLPTINPVSIAPVVNYSYTNSSNAIQTGSITGTSTSLTINVSVPILSVSKVSDKTSANTGVNITYTITVNNTGGITANSVMLMESVPQVASFIASSLIINGTATNGTTLPQNGISLGNIAVGSTVVVIYKITFNSVPITNPVLNLPVINYSYINSSNTSQNVSFTGTSTALTIIQPVVIPTASITKTANKKSANIGDTVTYTIGLSNTTSTSFSNVSVVESLLPGQNVISTSVTVNGVTVNNPTIQNVIVFSTSLTVPVGTLQPNTTATVIYQSTFSTATSNTIANNPYSSYSYVDSTGTTQNTSVTGTIVTATPIIMLSKTSDKTTANIGDTVTYTINISNTGGTTANSIMLMELVPQASSLIVNSLTVNGTIISGNMLPSNGINIGTMSIGSSASVVYKVSFSAIPTINPVINNPIINYSYVDYNNATQNLSFTGTSTAIMIENSLPPVTGTPNIIISKSNNKTSLGLLDQIQFTITIDNTFGVTANDIVLLETIPANASLVVNSLIVNGTTINGETLPLYGIRLGDLAVGKSATVIYKVYFYAMPLINPFKINPKVYYSYIDELGVVQKASIIGTSSTVLIVNNPIESIAFYVNTNTVSSGDIINCTLIFKNTGEILAKNVIIKDMIPTGMTYIQGSLKVNNVAVLGDLNVGIPIQDITPNQQVIVTFSIKIS